MGRHLQVGLTFSLLLACSEPAGSGPGQAGGNASSSGAGGNEAAAGGTLAGSGGSPAGQGGGELGGTSAAGTAGTTGAAGAGEAGGPGAPPSCDDLGGAPVVQSFSPKRFALGDDPSLDPECTDIVNPERGFRSTANLRSQPSFSGARADGHSVVYGAALLDDYLDQDLDQPLLDALSDAFAAAREAGVKLLPRFYYQANLEAGSNDASLERALAHIDQLAPLLQDNADVIAALHAGFVGAWGEWHGSTTGLHQEEPREQILAALLGALPTERMVLVRRPSFKALAYSGGPLSEATAFDGSDLARLGHLNDCFLASDNDVGTYQDDDEKEYAAADSAFTAVDGETCGENPPRSECESAIAELALHHWSTLNIDYHAGVLDSWRSGGCFEEIACRLGYRLVLLGHSSPASVARGEPLPLSLSLVNDGFARPFNARPVQLVLKGPEARVLPVAAVDWRTLAPNEPVELCLSAEVPADLPAGDYQLGVALPDAAPALADDERYAVRFSNDVTWQGGVNWLSATVTVQ